MTAAKPASKAVAKKPADHKPRVTKKEGVLSAQLRGQTWEIAEAALDDWEVLEKLDVIETQQNPAPMPSVLKALLGEEQYRKAMELIRDKDTGRITIEEGSKFLGELFEVFAPNS